METQRRFAIAFPQACIPTKNRGRIKYDVEKSGQHGTIRNWHKKTCGSQKKQETKRTLLLFVRHLAPVIGMPYTSHFKCVNLITAEKMKTWISSIFKMSWHSSAKHDIMMILSKHEVDVITKTMQVVSLHKVLILYFNIFLKHDIDHLGHPVYR